MNDSGESLLDRIIAAEPEHAQFFDKKEYGFADHTPSVYHRVNVTRATIDPDGRPLKLDYAHTPDILVFLTGRAESVYLANDLEHLTLTEEMVPDYLRFLFEVCGEGNMTVVESADALVWANADEQATIGPMIHPVQTRPRPGPYFQARFCALWEQMLVQMTVELNPSGRITRHAKQLLAEGFVACPAEKADLPDEAAIEASADSPPPSA